MTVERYLASLDPSDIGTDNKHITAFFNTGTTTEDRVAQLQSAIAELENGSHTLSLLSAYYELGQTYMSNNETSKAIQVWQRGLEIDNNTPEVGYTLAFTKAIADTYAASGNYKPAYGYLDSYYNTRDSLQEVTNAQALNELQLKYENVLLLCLSI